MEEGDKFCPACGGEAGGPAVSPAGEFWPAKEVSTDEAGSSRKGVLGISGSDLIFYVYGFFSGQPKESRKITISRIKSIVRTPVFNMLTISYNRAPEGSGALRRFIGMRRVTFKIKNWQTFIEKIKELSSQINPKIKIKC